MMPSPDDDMSLREIARTLSDFRHEMRGQLQQLVRADVYRAEQAADRARLAALEKDIERVDTDRAREREKDGDSAKANQRMIVAAFVTAGISFIGSLLLALT